MDDDKKIGAGAGLGGGPTAVSDAAAIAVSALLADPNYCANVGVSGTAVNIGVHNFKQAYNDWVAGGDPTAPSSPLPIDTGKYENVTADALASLNAGGQTAPPGCDGYVPPAPPPTPPTPPPTPPVVASSGLPGWAKILIYLLIAGGVIAGGIWLYRKVRQETRGVRDQA